jgi:DNA polymerase III subunit gamma/tau
MNDADPSGRVTEPDLLGAVSAPASEPASYRVLARKYRPATFDDLIGQDAMVRTITNAFATGRIPQAWILTGVRGVGKTTTARILARALNYALPDGSVTDPTVRMPTLGLHCAAIMESRHFDVIEMDAASHNSVDDVRQINDAIRYAPVSARYKVYILDEVHMLSGPAFNALLKTLEEPPPHAKFIFATTEIRKVPITILSRCQRFDLRRLEADRLMAHLETIAAREQVTAEPDALALIARAADGSVRDALSLFDQAIAHAAGPVRADDVQQMLGLADRSRVIDLFERLMRGDIAGALTELRDQYDSGADPLTVLGDLAEFTHFVTRVKAAPMIADDRSLPEAERVRGRALAASLSMRTLSRAWQMLFKGLAEVGGAAKPLAAAEMVLVRIAYAADLPTPDEVIRSLSKDTAGAGESSLPGERAGATIGGLSPASRADPAPPERGATRGPAFARGATAREARSIPAEAPPSTARRPIASFAELIAAVAEHRDLTLKTALERDVRLVRFEDGRLEVALEPSASKALIGDLARRLGELTGRRWMVALSSEPGEPPVRTQQEARQAELKHGVQADPLVQSVLARFPGAEIVAVRTRGGEDTEPAAVPDAEDVMPEPPNEDDTPAFGAHARLDDVDDAV